jgi:hypothetical protein
MTANCPVAIVSGRDLQDVPERVGIDRLYYAGSHGFDIAECGLEARNTARSAETFNRLLLSHARAWEHRQRFGIELENRTSRRENRIGMIVHLYIFHLLQCTSMNTMNMDLDVGIPSWGWHGEAYRGHILWAAGPDFRGRERYAQPLQGIQTGRRSDALLPAVR